MFLADCGAGVIVGIGRLDHLNVWAKRPAAAAAGLFVSVSRRRRSQTRLLRRRDTSNDCGKLAGRDRSVRESVNANIVGMAVQAVSQGHLAAGEV